MDLGVFIIHEYFLPTIKLKCPLTLLQLQGETEVLEKYCSPEIVERCKAERRVCEMQGTFYDNKVRK